MDYKRYFFIGIGGIGMSALARYFNAKGYPVAGYDRTASQLTRELEGEGINIFYDDDEAHIDAPFRQPDTSVVYTPAIPATNKVISFYRANGFSLRKRAEVLGDVTRREKALCVAGTHGKTTISTMTAHILHNARVDCNAFLGGISKNYTSNLILSQKSDLVVIEADEFDRSFHHLAPYIALVSATDADHLDIYGSHEAYIESFDHFTSLIETGGALVHKYGIALNPRLKRGVRTFTYSADDKRADFHAQNVRIGDGRLVFDLKACGEIIADIELGVPVMINVENGVAAAAISLLAGASGSEVREGLRSYAGVRRRFDVRYSDDKFTLIDDYAHHPAEVEKSIDSVLKLYQGKKIVVAFQPHLYTRTRDFYKEFAAALSKAPEVVVVELYPAREQPIEGVDSNLICREITAPRKQVCAKADVVKTLSALDFDVLLTLGAGDLDTLIPDIITATKQNR